MNHVFIYGHAHFEGRDKDAEPYNHGFATTISLQDGKAKMGAGLNFGSPHGYDIDGTMGDQKVTQAVLMPISEETYDRFEKMITDLHMLERQYRSPFYFSRYHTASLYLERPDESPIDLMGKPRNVSDIDFRADGFIDAHGDHVWPDADMDNIPVYKDISYVHANCVEMTNFIAKCSGIDMGQVNPQWMDMGYGRDLERTLTQTFNAGKFKMGQDKSFFYELCVSPDRHEAWKVSSDNGENRTVDELINAVTHVKGEPETFFEFMNTRKPFDCEPIAVPPYLAKSLKEVQPKQKVDLHQAHIPDSLS